MKVRKKPIVVEAITFDELVEYGKANGANIVNGMPWSFSYRGHPITHENDDCYLVPTLEGTMRFERGSLLMTGVKGEIYPIKPDIFAESYEVVDEEDEEDYGAVAYRAYGDAVFWQTMSGSPMPKWEDQLPRLRIAWRAAGVAAAQRARRSRKAV